MSSIGSLGSTSSSMAMMHGMRRPDPAKMAEDLFSKLDTSGQGYLQKSDLQAAYDSISTSSSSSTTSSTDTSSVDDLFAQLDGDSDGKVTQQEFSDSLQKVADQLEQQFQSMRMQGGGMGGMPPPPPPSDDAGFTKDELTSQLDEIGSTDSVRSTLISNIVQNFEAADTNGDGKVSFSEAQAYDQSSSTSSGSSTTASTATDGTSSSSAGNSLDAKVMLQIMRLMQAYGQNNDSSSVAGSQLSVSA